MGVRSWLWPVAVLVVAWSGVCQGHGRLIDPPSRASAWRYGFDTPHDYNDNEGFCGGFNYQYQEMGGKCGLCGDPWDQNPRQHEAGGKYATGTIVRQYTVGQDIEVKVDITANHRGHFEFRICPNNNPAVEATQTCLNANPLPLADGSGFYYTIGPEVGIHAVKLKLPQGLTCTQCVFQWRYVAGNNWGICEDGSGQVGCGPQEEFRACADVAISGSAGPEPSVIGGGTNSRTTSTQAPVTQPPPNTTLPPRTTSSRPRTTSTRPRTTTRRPQTTTAAAPSSSGSGSGGCHAVGVWQAVPGMDEWCENNCNHVPPYCPASHCACN